MHRKPRPYFVLFVVWLSFIFGELFSIKIMFDSFGTNPDRADWVISMVFGGPFIGFLLFVPILFISTVISRIMFPNDH